MGAVADGVSDVVMLSSVDVSMAASRLSPRGREYSEVLLPTSVTSRQTPHADFTVAKLSLSEIVPVL